MEFTQILTIAGKEFRDRMRNRWVLAMARPEARVRSWVRTDSSTARLKKARPSSTELTMKPP